MKRKIPFLTFVLIITLSIGLVNVAQASKIVKKYRNSKSNIQTQINKIKGEKSALQNVIGKKRNKANEIAKIEAGKSATYRKFKAQLDYVNKIEENIKKDIADAEDEYDDKMNQLIKRLRTINENSSLSYLHTILSSTSIVDFVNRVEMVEELVNYDKKLIDEASDAKKNLKFKLEENKKEKEIAKSDAKKALDELNKIRKSKSGVNSQIANTQAQINALIRKENQLEAESRRYDALIRQQQSTGKYVGGKFRWPTPGYYRVSSQYGRRFHPIFKVWRMHSGIDISVPHGVSILAVGDGRVLSAGWSNGYGNCVVIDHGGGVTTLYAHASRLLVRKGQKVKAGKVIAKVGSTGWSTGAHLHFEVRKNGNTQNPLNGWIRK